MLEQVSPYVSASSDTTKSLYQYIRTMQGQFLMYGDLIREHREKLGLNQGELVEQLQAAGLNVTRAALSHWETGRNPSPLDNLRDALILAEVLKIDLNEVAGFVVNEGIRRDYSDAARNAALIVEHLPQEIRQMALEQLRAIDKHYSAKS